jgi:NAD(P)H-hydrate epimerase
MATAGMGDILSGVIGAWLAQGLNTHDAAELGVVLHAAAADLAVQQIGQYGLAASDMPAALRDVINAVLRDDNERCQ